LFAAVYGYDVVFGKGFCTDEPISQHISEEQKVTAKSRNVQLVRQFESFDATVKGTAAEF
jgi:hypothetical protein